MTYSHFRYARRIDADTLGIYHNDQTKLLQLDKGTAGRIDLAGGLGTSTNSLKILANTTDARPYIYLGGNVGVDFHAVTGATFRFYYGGTDTTTIGAGYFKAKEITTPGATTDYWAIYAKNDNKLYFQDGAGTEHTVTIV